MPRLFKNLTADQANTCAVVLSSSGIAYQAAISREGWEIWVRREDYELAVEYMKFYFRENRDPSPGPTSSAKETAVLMRTYSGVWIALLLLVIHAAIGYHQVGGSFIQEFGASAAQIMEGQVYRSTTALMLHSDALHLIGNMVGVALFGSVVCSLAGSGLGWLMILLTGILGNLANALFRQGDHLSIGASTAVFGAIGILVACQFWKKVRLPDQRLKAWLPLGAGLALLAILGSGGQRVDLLAHVFGLMSGVLIGLVYSIYLPDPFPRRYQSGCHLISFLLLALAWLRPF